MFKKFICIVILFCPLTVLSQPRHLLDSNTKRMVIQSIGQQLCANYVFPDTAIAMSKYLSSKWDAGSYSAIKDAVTFANTLTVDLYSVYNDSHMLVRFTPPDTTKKPRAQPAKQDENEDPLLRIKQANYGLRKVEVLYGNIGYIKIDNFWADSIYGKETVKSTLAFISNTNAVVIDVRDCGGGSQDAVKLICGYFLDKPTHINDMFDRSSNSVTQYWTRPDSTFTALYKMPLYIVANSKTFSAGEEFCYDLQCINRATIIGESTGGGAHGTYTQDIGHGFAIDIPYSRAVNPITKTNWEGNGVTPNINVASDSALETAEMMILRQLLSQAKNAEEVFAIQWSMELTKAKHHPVVVDSITLKSYAGVFGDRTFTYKNGKLFYQRTGRPSFELEAMTPTVMKGIGNTYFKIEFIKESSGVVNNINAYYQDNRVERATRTR